MNNKYPNFVFFGTPEISVEVLDILKNKGLIPSLIITAPDRPRGRGMKVTPPPVKIWADKNNIPALQPEKLDSEFNLQLITYNLQLYVVVAYGKILPKSLLDIPELGTINLHYSLLPKLRGASPVETAILENINPSGVTIMFVDEKMDHGPIIFQKEVYFENWPVPKAKMFKKFNEIGGELLAKIIIDFSNGKLEAKEQEDTEATYTKKITKENGLIYIDGDPEENYRKFLAFNPWPGTYFLQNGKRVKITDAILEDGHFKIKKIIPENGKEQTFGIK